VAGELETSNAKFQNPKPPTVLEDGSGSKRGPWRKEAEEGHSCRESPCESARAQWASGKSGRAVLQWQWLRREGAVDRSRLCAVFSISALHVVSSEGRRGLRNAVAEG